MSLVDYDIVLVKLTTHTPASAEVKNGGVIPPFPHILMSQCLIT
jgi:hypothetical protein